MSAALKTGADARAMSKTKFPEEFSKKVDMTKVNLPVIKKWVSDEITRILNSDDDVVTEMTFSIIEGSKFPNIKQLQTDLSGFLDKDAAPFCLELWKLCLSAQASPNGIPKELLEAKKFELIQGRIAEDKAREEARQREIEDRERERERGQRGRGGRGGGGRGRGRDRDDRYDRRPPSRDYSRSPPRRRESGRTDSYVPRGGRDDNPRRRRRSPSYGRSTSRSRSPPRQRRRRNSSSDGSRSPPRRSRAASSGAEGDRPRRRSPPRRRPSYSDDSRSPPPDRRRRRRSPSRSRSPTRRSRNITRSRTRSPPPRRKERLSPDDLISKRSRSKDKYRLSRERSSYGGTPDGARRGSRDDQPANGGAKDERQSMGKYQPLRITKQQLEARLAAAKREAERRAALKRKDSFLGQTSRASQE